MADEAKAIATMVANIEKQTGKTLAQLGKALDASGLTKHGELRGFLMEKFGLGYGQANTVVHLVKQAATPAASAGDDALASIYAGKKAELRPVHEALLAAVSKLGDFETAPKKDYVSYRRKKQFLMVGPKTATAIEIGLFAKSLPTHARLKEMPANSMCRYTTRISTVAEIDKTLLSWIKQSFGESG